MNDLILDIADQAGLADPGFSPNPKKIQQWVRALPVTDMLLSAQQLSAAVAELNTQKMPATRRYELLELYSKPLADFEHELSSYFDASLPPLRPEKSAIIEQMDELYSQLARGYKAIVIGTVASWVDWDKDWVFGASIYKAIKLLTLVVANGYRCYAKPRPNTWRDIHQLYRYAKKQSVHQTSIFRQYGESDPLKTVGQLYKYALLLDLSDPYHLSHEEFHAASNYLVNFSRYVNLISYGGSPDLSHSGKSLVDLQSDCGVLRFEGGAESSHHMLMVLDAAPILKRVDQHIHALKYENLAAIQTTHGEFVRKTDLPLLERLSVAWRFTLRRQEERVYKAGELELAVGVRGIHFAVNGMEVFSPPGNDKLDSEDSFVAVLRDAGTLMDIKLSLYQTETWPRINLSKSGAAILRTTDKKNKLSVGHLIALRNDVDDMTVEPDWQLAVVRRLNAKQNGNIAVGTQVLSTNIEAIAIKPTQGVVHDATYTPCLLIREHSFEKPMPILITDTALYEEGAVMKLLRADVEISIVAKAVAEQRESFTAFYFDILKS